MHIAAIALAGMVSVVVGPRPVGDERVSQREMQLAAVGQWVRRRALADGVEVVEQDLVGDEQAQQTSVSPAGERSEQTGALGVEPLAAQRGERVGADAGIGYRPRQAAPVPDLACDVRMDPGQLARADSAERGELTQAGTCSVENCGNGNLLGT
jgi:hypothetical protein